MTYVETHRGICRDVPRCVSTYATRWEFVFIAMLPMPERYGRKHDIGIGRMLKSDSYIFQLLGVPL